MDFMPKFIRKFFLDRAIKKLVENIESNALDLFLEGLLEGMRLFFLFDKDYRRNIEGFNAKYVFKSKDGNIAVSAIYEDSKMKVSSSIVSNPEVAITFKNSKVLKEFLLSENPDIIGGILNNNFTFDGNLNYLAKFAYMAKHLQLKFAF